MKIFSLISTTVFLTISSLQAVLPYDLSINDLANIKRGQTVQGFTKYTPEGSYNYLLQDGSDLKHQHNHQAAIEDTIKKENQYISELKKYNDVMHYIGIFITNNTEESVVFHAQYGNNKEEEKEDFVKKDPK